MWIAIDAFQVEFPTVLVSEDGGEPGSSTGQAPPSGGGSTPHFTSFGVLLGANYGDGTGKGTGEGTGEDTGSNQLQIILPAVLVPIAFIGAVGVVFLVVLVSVVSVWRYKRYGGRVGGSVHWEKDHGL